MEQISDKEFIEQIYEIAFGDNAINRDFTRREVLNALFEYSQLADKYLEYYDV